MVDGDSTFVKKTVNKVIQCGNAYHGFVSDVYEIRKEIRALVDSKKGPWHPNFLTLPPLSQSETQ